MKEFPIEALAEIIKAAHGENINGSFTDVSTDSRNIKAGECFFAISGETFDGHDFIDDIFKKGAACAVVSKDIENVSPKNIILKVKDTIASLGDFAAVYRRLNNFKVVAITGSVGKTTTRQIAYEVLRRHFRTHTAPKNFNNNIGLPSTLLGADEENEIVLTELGTDHPGEIAPLSKIAQPDIAIITTVAPAHLEGFGSIQAIFEEKLSISQGLKQGGVLIINGDNEFLVKACKSKNIKFISFGESSHCDVRMQNIRYEGTRSKFTIDGIEVMLPLPGPGNVKNALAAFAVCRRFAITAKDFAEGVKTLSAVPMRTELLKIGALTIINDCYNANPVSMKNALDILANVGNSSKQNSRRVFICGDMAELGGQSENLHRKLGEYAAKTGVNVVLAVGKFAETMVKAAKRTAKNLPETKCFRDTASVCNNLEEFVKDSDIVLVKGSRASKLEKVTERLRQIFEK
jgi:UDP-N-acetylmuramoyl-tripeptide--D-alanyl-D-alanine ligase